LKESKFSGEGKLLESNVINVEQTKSNTLLDDINSRLNNPLEGLKKSKGKAKEENPFSLTNLISDEPDLDDSELLKSTEEFIKHDNTKIEDIQESELINKIKNLKSIDDLNKEDKEILKIKPDILIESFKNLPESIEKESLIIDNIDQNIKGINVFKSWF
jgi:hypothetical protein